MPSPKGLSQAGVEPAPMEPKDIPSELPCCSDCDGNPVRHATEKD